MCLESDKLSHILFMTLWGNIVPARRHTVLNNNWCPCFQLPPSVSLTQAWPDVTICAYAQWDVQWVCVAQYYLNDKANSGNVRHIISPPQQSFKTSRLACSGKLVGAFPWNLLVHFVIPGKMFTSRCMSLLHFNPNQIQFIILHCMQCFPTL